MPEDNRTHDPGWDGSRIRKPHERSQDIIGPPEALVEVRMLKKVGDRKADTVCKIDRALAHEYVVVMKAAEYVDPKAAEPPSVNDRSVKHPPRGR